MRKLFSIFILLLLPFSLSGKDRCYCGTSNDAQVGRIGNKICEFLVDIDLLMPPEVFDAVNYDGDEDDPEYINAYKWRSSFHGQVHYGFSNWECEYVYDHSFGWNGNLWEPAETLSLLENISNEIQRCRDSSIKKVEAELRDLKYEYFPHGFLPRSQMKEERRALLEELEENKKKYAPLETKFEDLEIWVSKAYQDIFRNCLDKHGNETAYYHLGLFAFAGGDFFSAMEHLKRIRNFDTLSTRDQIEARYHLGKTQNLLGLYQEAIQALTQVIQADPERKEAYFERALAYFEKGQFDQAIEDYIQSDVQVTTIGKNSRQSLEFAGGLLKGASFGAAHTIEDFAPSMLCSLQGLANGLWAFACDPNEVSKEMVQAARNLYDFIQDASALETLRTLIPELDDLIGDWKDHTQFRKGELIGTIIGKYGTDAFLLVGSGKALKLFEEIRVANAALTFDAMKGFEKQKRFLEKSTKWHEAHVAKIKEMQRKALALGKEYSEINLPESKARKLLHNLGVKTFSRPKGININDFHVRVSNSGGGLRYVYKNNENFEIRIMPGNELSKFPSQRTPYVVQRSPEGFLDKKGKIVPKKSEAAHIPLSEYNIESFQGSLKK